MNDNINEAWLLAGEGEMLKTDTSPEIINADLSKLLSIIDSPQETINRQSKIIETLTSKM